MKDILKIIRFSASLKRYYIAIAFFVVILAGLNLVNPFLTKWLIDLITNYSKGQTVVLGDALVPLVLLLVSGVVLAFLSNINGFLGDRMAVKLNTLLSRRYYDHLMRLPIAFYDSEQTGKITARLERSIASLSQLMNALANNFVQFFLTTFVTLGVIAIYSWPIALLLTFIFPSYIYITHLSSKSYQKHQMKINQNLDLANGRFVESIGQVRVVKSFVRELGELKYFAQKRARIEAIARDQSIQWHTYDIWRRLALGVIFFLIYVVITWQALGGAYSVGTAVLLITLANQAQFPLFGASFMIEGIQRAQADSRDYFKIMALEPSITDPEGAKRLKVTGGEITFDKVQFSYEQGGSVLRDVSFTIPAHSKVALVGESGEGKSTIANLIVRFYEAQAGTIAIDGTPISSVTQRSLRQSVGIVFQDPALFSGTIEENIAYGLERKYTKADLESAARMANASDFIAKLPKGYQTEVGERGVKLSGGQKQRIIIARALLKNPPILILDEATSSLDAKSEAQVQEALERLMEGRTTIIIAHRLSTIAGVDLIIGLKSGKIAEQGTPDKLADKKDGIYAELLRLQTAGNEKMKQKLKQFDIAA
ncbi:ABC transporter ATP-binding protein [Candidatus Saccharibacteria bacterium]|nr:ABC transporter ATP-binding protein [Candidatus Saccharibacteria bacterium]